MFRRGLAVVLLVVGLALGGCQTTSSSDPATGAPQTNPSEVAFASFEMEVNAGTITPKRGNDNTLVYDGQKIVDGVVYDCLIVRSSSDGSTLQKAKSIFTSTLAAATTDGCIRNLDPAKPTKVETRGSGATVTDEVVPLLKRAKRR